MIANFGRADTQLGAALRRTRMQTEPVAEAVEVTTSTPAVDMGARLLVDHQLNPS